MSQLIKLHEDCDQSPWLDNITRGWITSGEIRRWIERGVRGITSNPTIFQKAMESADYDDELARLARSGASTEEAYWQLVGSDISAAADLLSGVHERSGGVDGWVSVEVSPGLAHDTEGTIEAARTLSRNLGLDNLYIKVPATAEGIEAIRVLTSEGIPVNVTLIFSLDRYADVIEAYLSGLEAHQGNLSHISSVGSFFISRVDTEVDRRLNEVGTNDALDLLGTAAITQGKLAYQLAMDAFSGPRWEALAERGANMQRPLWASTSTKNPDYPDTYYVDSLIGPHTVNTLPEATLEAFDDHGTVVSTLDSDPEADRNRWQELGQIVDLAAVSAKLETEGVASFAKSFDEVLAALADRVDHPAGS
ncbi:MAG: transaldolase [Microthrixaceae bacterium]|nr:transaldolase [Microthrixaceae bacterium]